MILKSDGFRLVAPGRIAPFMSVCCNWLLRCCGSLCGQDAVDAIRVSTWYAAFCALGREQDTTCLATQIIRHFSGDAQRCSTQERVPTTPQRGGSLLRTYGRDLTQEAREGRLDPLIGRSDVLARTLQVLLRRTKNNPLLVGDPGVGKTAVVEGLAQLLIGPDAPPAYAHTCFVAVVVVVVVRG